AQSGGSTAPTRCRTRFQMPPTAQPCLWLRPARLRGGVAQGLRYRQCPDGDPYRAREGPQGSLRDAVTGSARHVAERRSLMPVLPRALPRIRHYGFLANGTRAENIAKVRELLSVAPRMHESESSQAPAPDQACALPHPCPCCGGRMFIIEFFEAGCEPTHRPSSPPPVVRIDTS